MGTESIVSRSAEDWVDFLQGHAQVCHFSWASASHVERMWNTTFTLHRTSGEPLSAEWWRERERERDQTFIRILFEGWGSKTWHQWGMTRLHDLSSRKPFCGFTQNRSLLVMYLIDALIKNPQFRVKPDCPHTRMSGLKCTQVSRSQWLTFC